MSELRKSFLHSVAWTTGSNISGFLINFFLGVWLARILGPEAYGLVGMVMVVTGFGRLFMDFGFGEALIQNQDTKDEDFSSVFWFNIIVAIILFILFFALSEFVANFYTQPNLKSISQVISFVFILNALGMVQRVKLEKELKFKEIGIAEVLSSLLSIMIAILFALKDFGVWSLVYLNLLKPTFYSLFIWLFSKWWPSFVLNSQSLIKLSRFSFALLLNGILETIASSLDKILIGRSLGDASLGIYSKSIATVRMPVMQIISAIGRVVFPSFASIQNDNDRIFAIYKKMVLIISTIVLPIMVIFYFFKTEILLLMFGDKWTDMIPIFGIMAITAGLIPFNILADSVVKAKGSVKYLNLTTFIEKPIVISAIVLGISLGSIYTISITLTFAIFLIFIVKSIIVCLSLSQSIWYLLYEHLKTTYLLILPVVTLIIFANFTSDENLVLKIIVTIFSFGFSIFLLRKSLLSPTLEFIKTYKKND